MNMVVHTTKNAHFTHAYLVLSVQPVKKRWFGI